LILSTFDYVTQERIAALGKRISKEQQQLARYEDERRRIEEDHRLRLRQKEEQRAREEEEREQRRRQMQESALEKEKRLEELRSKWGDGQSQTQGEAAVGPKKRGKSKKTAESPRSSDGEESDAPPTSHEDKMKDLFGDDEEEDDKLEDSDSSPQKRARTS
jgi:hypothetical protein